MSKANLFIVAAPRSGSTQLAAWLGTHPEIEVSSIKEPNHFSSHLFPKEFVASTHLNDVDPERYVRERSTKQMQFAIFRELEHYEYLFSAMHQKWKVDASTTYLQCAEAPIEIFKYNPEAKIILLIRNPLQRAISHYRLAVRTGRTNLTLAEELQQELAETTPVPARFLLRYSKYDDGLKAYRNTFPSQSLMEVSFENMIRDPSAAMASICDFLGVAKEGVDLGVSEQNASDAPRFQAFNIWLHNSGLKTYLRRLLPKKVKRLIKPVYFSSEKISIPEEHIALLKAHL